MKEKVIFCQVLLDDLAVVVVHVEDADLAAERRDVADDVACARLENRKFVFICSEGAHGLDKGFDGEGVVLRGDAEAPLDLLAVSVFFHRELVHLINLRRVGEKFRSFICHGDAAARAEEDGDAEIGLELPHRRGQCRLRNEELPGGLVHRFCFRDYERVMYLLKCHSVLRERPCGAFFRSQRCRMIGHVREMHISLIIKGRGKTRNAEGDHRGT